MADPIISTTSAALLGQLALREQTPYEMTREMARNLRYFWPRAASHVYREVKRLAANGWATAERSSTGHRPRTVYRITPHGRSALAGWLAAPSAGTALEHEPLLRVFLAASGSREDLLAAVSRARADAEQMLAVGRPLAGEYLSATHPFQDQVHIRALTFDYLYNWARFTVAWAERTEQEVRRWTDLAPTADKHRRALDHLRAILDEEP
ncbi:MAG: PadR family transcriptional regulator [Solirubrobacteraceae bacterium]